MQIQRHNIFMWHELQSLEKKYQFIDRSVKTLANPSTATLRSMCYVHQFKSRLKQRIDYLKDQLTPDWIA